MQLRLILLLVFVLACARGAGAQSAATAAATQRPADFDKQALTALRRPEPPSQDAPVMPPEKKTATPAAQSKGPRVHVSRVLIEGNTVLPAAEVKQLRSTLEGKRAGIGDVDALTARIEQAYRRRGYFLARAAAPPQEVTGGTVRIVVSEGHYGEIQVEGNKHYPTEFIRRFFGPTIRGGLVRERQLLEALVQLNQLPDLAVQSVFTPGNKPGTTDVILRVHDAHPLHVSVDYNNFGSRLVGRNRVGISLSAGRAFTEGDELVLRVVEPFGGKSDPFYQGSYTSPVGRGYQRAGLLFATAQTRVRGAGLDDLDIRGVAEIGGVTWQLPLESRQDGASGLNASFVFKNIENFVLNDRTTSRDNLRMVTAGYSVTRRQNGRRFTGSALLVQGLGTLLDGSPNDQPLPSRAGTGNAFTKLTLDAAVTAPLGRRDSLVLRASAQGSTRPLVVAEQFAIGGPDSVRGFVQSEALGDDGYGFSAELRHELIAHRSHGLQGAMFVDHGQVFLHRPQPGETSSRSLTGAGVGVRANFASSSSVRLDFGFPLDPSRNSDDDGFTLYALALHRY